MIDAMSYQTRFPDAGLIGVPCGSDGENSPEIKDGRGGCRPGAGRKPKRLIATLPPTERWYCVHTAPMAQIIADIEIRLAGFRVFNPSVWKPATKPRRMPTGGIHPGLPDRIVPLFPRYFFVRLHLGRDAWQPIRSLQGVDRIISNTAASPVAVPEEAVEAILAMCMPNGCIYPPSTPCRPFARGVNLRVQDGPFANLSGICDWSDGKRVRLLLEIMGGTRCVTVPHAAVGEAQFPVA